MADDQLDAILAKAAEVNFATYDIFSTKQGTPGYMYATKDNKTEHLNKVAAEAYELGTRLRDLLPDLAADDGQVAVVGFPPVIEVSVTWKVATNR